MLRILAPLQQVTNLSLENIARVVEIRGDFRCSRSLLLSAVSGAPDQDKQHMRQFDHLVHQLLMNIRVQYMRAYDLKHTEEMLRMEGICELWSKRNGVAQRWLVNGTPIEAACLKMMEKHLGKRHST